MNLIFIKGNNMKLKIKQKLYKYSTIYLMEYEVFGILQREDGEYYQIRCKTCKDHNFCEVLIKLNDNDKFKYVSMLNENEDNKQYYWHTTDDDNDYYCLTKKEALEKVLNRNIKLCEKQIKEKKKIIQNIEKNIIEYKEQLKAL